MSVKLKLITVTNFVKILWVHFSVAVMKDILCRVIEKPVKILMNVSQTYMTVSKHVTILLEALNALVFLDMYLVTTEEPVLVMKLVRILLLTSKFDTCFRNW